MKVGLSACFPKLEVAVCITVSRLGLPVDSLVGAVLPDHSCLENRWDKLRCF